MSEERKTAFVFPCTFPIKVIGLVGETFVDMVFDVVRLHAPDVRREEVAVRASHGGKYVSVSLTFVAGSQQQLDELYRDLGRRPGVVMIL